jgi:Glycosyltransferase family 87
VTSLSVSERIRERLILQTGNLHSDEEGPAVRAAIPVETVGPQRLRRSIVVCATLAWIVAAPALASEFALLATRTGKWDFSLYYVASLSLRRGASPYLTDINRLGDELSLQTGSMKRVEETPTFLMCFEPLTLMSPTTAYWIWIGINAAAIATAFYVLLISFFRCIPSLALLIGALAVSYPPFRENMMFAQSQGLVLCLAALSMLAVRRSHDEIAGGLIGLAALIRAYPFVLLGYFASRRRWSAIYSALLVMLIGGIFTLVIVGMKDSLSFMWAVGQNGSGYWPNLPGNVSIAAFVARAFHGFSTKPYSPGASVGQIATVAICDFSVLTLSAWSSIRAPEEEDHELRTFPVWIVAMVLVSPIAWAHYMILLYVPLVSIAVSAIRRETSSVAVAAAGLCYSLPLLRSAFLHVPSLISALVVKELHLEHVILEALFASVVFGFIAACSHAMFHEPSGGKDAASALVRA